MARDNHSFTVQALARTEGSRFIKRDRSALADDRLLDVLKEAALDTGLMDAFETSASRVTLSKAALAQRLLLCLYGLGTNAGLKRVAGATPDVSYEELLHVHRRFIHAPALREACARVANATLAIRNAAVWGDAGTACASNYEFGAWDRNLMTEWHARYGGRAS
ncbi:Tn3 family transposase [Sphingobium indicum]